MARAVWMGRVIAESDDTKVVEGNVYFPPDSVDRRYLVDSPVHSRCYWKGKASYYDVVVDGHTNPAAAWYYPRPWPPARFLTGYVAFWRGVEIEE